MTNTSTSRNAVVAPMVSSQIQAGTFIKGTPSGHDQVAGGLSRPSWRNRLPGAGLRAGPPVMTRTPRGDTPLRGGPVSQTRRREPNPAGSGGTPAPRQSADDVLVGGVDGLQHLLVGDGPADPERVPAIPADVCRDGHLPGVALTPLPRRLGVPTALQAHSPGAAVRTGRAQEGEDLVGDLGDEVAVPRLVLPGARLGQAVGDEVGVPHASSVGGGLRATAGRTRCRRGPASRPRTRRAPAPRAAPSPRGPWRGRPRPARAPCGRRARARPRR